MEAMAIVLLCPDRRNSAASFNGENTRWVGREISEKFRLWHGGDEGRKWKERARQPQLEKQESSLAGGRQRVLRPFILSACGRS